MSNLKFFRMALTLVLAFVAICVQAQTVNGTVKDENGDEVIGASVVEQGTKNGVTTDLDGHFTINVSANSTLVISYVGMETQKVKVGGKSTVNVVLKDAGHSLNDLVVIGYGAVKKKDLTGAVATVKSDVLEAVPVANATEALTGKLAGVQVTTTEGSPDADVKIRVRGGGSITQSNDPLFIVDGFPVDGINDIPASEIEDITVLKDASSTAIYGSRGANGVILVTTKSGKSGKVNVSYNAYYSWKKIAKTMDVLPASDYAKWQYELALLKNPNDISSYTDYFGNYTDIDMYDNCAQNDWQDLTYGRTGHTFNHNLSVNGGSDNIKYAFTYTHMNDKAIMEGSEYKRDNFSLKLNTKPSKRTTLDFQARYAMTHIEGAGANEAAGVYDTDRRLKYSVIYTPIPLKNLDPSAGSSDDDLGNLYNPIQSIWDNDRVKDRKNLNLNGAFGWEVIKNLKLKTEFGYDNYNQYDKRFWGITTYYVKNVPAGDNQNKPAIRLVDTNRHRFRNTNTVSFDFKDIIKSKKHSLNLMAGHEYIITKKRANTNEAHGFPVDFDSDTAWKLTNQGVPYSIDDFYSPDDKLLSYFGRVNYNFLDKYLLTATMRADASSKFADGNRWGYFPSVAAAWRISSEKFMQGTSSWLDDLKLRLSYGTAGNNNIPVGQLAQEYSAKSTTWINGVSTYWAPSKVMANPDLKWETTITRNVGLDFTMFGSKLTGTIDAYWNTTKDLLIEFPVSGTGYDTQYRNMGETSNKGVELSLTWNAIDKKNFGLSLSGNIGFNKTKIEDLGIMNDFGMNSRWASTEIGQDYWIAVGGAVGQIRGYVNDGRYEVSDFTGYDAATDTWMLKEGVADGTAILGKIRPGTMKLKKIADDGTNVIGENDQRIIGDVNPDCTGGFALNARLYGFDLSANFNFSVGNDIYNANKIEYTSTSKYQYRNMIDVMADGKRWTNLNPDGTLCNDPAMLEALNANTSMWSPYMKSMVLTDWAIEKASFLRLNTLTLGYTLPKELVKKAYINSLRLYASVYNVFCITNYSGFDPESDCIRTSNLTPGVDYSGYPRSRQFVIGLNLNF